MARKLATLLMILNLFVPLVVAHSKQTETPEETQIKQYRLEINELASRVPPSEAQDAHAVALVSLRRKLRDLLIEKRGGLKRDVQVLRSPETRDYVARLEVVVSSITAELDVLDSVLAKTLSGTGSSVVSPTPKELPSPQPTPRPLPPDVDFERSAFQATVDSFSAEQLRAAARPRNLPPLDCLSRNATTSDVLSQPPFRD